MGRFQLHPGRGAKNAKKEESEWEGAEEKYKKFSAETSRVLGAKNALYQVVMTFTQAFLLLQPPAPRGLVALGQARVHVPELGLLLVPVILGLRLRVLVLDLELALM